MQILKRVDEFVERVWDTYNLPLPLETHPVLPKRDDSLIAGGLFILLCLGVAATCGHYLGR